MKKLLMIALTAVLCFAVAQTNTDLSGQLTVQGWNNMEALAPLVPAFNEQYPNIQVEFVELPWGAAHDRMLANCAAGGINMPDVFAVEISMAPIFWGRFPECFTDLNEFGANELRDEFLEVNWLAFSHDENVFAIPWDAGPVVMFYRRDLYEAAGIDPDEIETWDDWIDAGQTMFETTDGAVRMGIDDIGQQDLWFRMIAKQNGCLYFDRRDEEVVITITQPGCVAALETMKRMADAGVLAFGLATEQGMQLAGADRLASIMFGAWFEGFLRANLPDQAGQWGIMRMPASIAGTRAANEGGSALGISAASDNKEAAWAFITFMLANAETQAAMLEDVGYVPAYLPAQNAPYVSQPQPYWGDQAIWDLVLDTMDEIPVTHATQYFSEGSTIMSTIQADYLAGRYTSAEDALRAAAEQIAAATGLQIEE